MRGMWLLVAACVVAAAPLARAEKLAVGAIHGEADVADEAVAVGHLVRSALRRGADRTVVATPANVTIRSAADALTKAGADHVVLGDLSRDGTGLRMTVVIAGRDGTRDISFVRTGDGDVRKLAQGVVDRVSAQLTIAVNPVSDVSLGAMRPFVAAAGELASDPIRAATALADADPLAIVGVPSAVVPLVELPAAVPMPLGVIAARAIGDTKRLEALAATTDPKLAAPALAARALALMRADLAGADALLAKPPKDPLVQFARLVIARARNQPSLHELVKVGLGGPHARAVLGVAATLLPTQLPKDLHVALVAYSEKLKPTAGVAARIGLNAALAGADLGRALALVSVRDLSDYELTELEPLLAKAPAGVALRLRAELAMRRADGTESVAVGAFATNVPDDPRAHRYLGWQLVAEHKYGAAAEEFAKAGASHERARALMLAGDPSAALASLERPPQSAEELVIAARVSLAAGRIDEAAAHLDIAEQAAPASAAVHSALIGVLAKKPDPVRLQIARLIIEQGGAPPPTEAGGSAAPLTSTAVAIGSGAGSSQMPLEAKLISRGFDPELLEAMLGALPGLRELPHRSLLLAQADWKSGWFSFRTVDTKPVREAVATMLGRPPYRLDVRSVPNPLPSRVLDRAALARFDEADALLVVYVAPAGEEANVTLTLYPRGATEAIEVTQRMSIPGIVGWNTDRFTLIGMIAGLLVAAGLVWALRSRGLVIVEMPRAPDVDDEVLCIEISKSPTRPKLGSDPATFHSETRKAGAITKRRFATLVASGAKFVVPAGHWYVHLYGTVNRNGRIQEVPPWHSKEVDISRGAEARVVLDLASKLAEVSVEVVAESRRGIAVWVNQQEAGKVYTDADGKATLHLAVGTHEIHLAIPDGAQITKTMQVVAPKLHRLSVNVERERRVASGVALDLDVKGLELDAPAARVDSGVKLRATKPAAAAGAIERPMVSAPTHFDESLARPREHPRTATPVPGEMLLGRYRIIAELGRGAMGVVHRAWDEQLERAVAIKEMADDLRTHPEAMRLFTQEAKALAQLNHTNIVAMYDQITDARGVYMIMEFVDGRPLEAIIQSRGALPWREAIGIADQLCAGLAYAHARKVIHRDIKPANIFVAQDRTVKLGDFGLARVMREVTIKRTEIRGTPLYMAPEQITGTDVDHRVDLYAIGCTLFELVCGRPPFIDGDILYAQLHCQPPRPSSLAGDVPAALDELILSLLAKQGDDRPGSANEVRAALRTVQGVG